MAGRYDSNPFAEEEVNPFAVNSHSSSSSSFNNFRVVFVKCLKCSKVYVCAFSVFFFL